MCNCEPNTMDIKTPKNVYLSAFYKRSFAYYTLKKRMPVIITNLVDDLARKKLKIFQEYGEDAKEELKTVIGDLSELKYEIQTNKPLKLLTSQSPDANIYNEYIMKHANGDNPPTHFHTIWLLSECYMYRRIRQIFENTKVLQNYDPFQSKKEETYSTDLPVIRKVGKHCVQIVSNSKEATKNEFIVLMKINLWGNKCDLSLSLGTISKHTSLFNTTAMDHKVLCDQLDDIWNAIYNTESTSDIVDIVLDNAGYEVFTDLCLLDYIVSKKLAKSIRIYVKTIPWFISDVMKHDFDWMLLELKKSDDENLIKLGERWTGFIEKGIWSIVESDFWTLPHEYTFMADINPQLYRQLAEAKMVFFKGDLNYRKLFGEKNWDPTTSIEKGLNSFNPTKLAILRIVKADIVCGLQQEVVEKVEASNPKWMETGEYGLIQFCDKIVVV
ncbi:hypothetical protein JTB14_037035 [Gonioctena quinquepunctata]|nr:hypothetical protein JTB14_037035 [Gonioctena quinquepunctata]